MPNYELYIPSVEGYQIFLTNLEKDMPDWLTREAQLLKEFSNTPGNTDEKIVKHRVREVNRRYSTRVSHKVLDEMVSFIVHSDFDRKLDSNDYKLVDELRRAHTRSKKSGRVDYLSFASKYCHHCRPNRYPIYDSVNVCVFEVFLGYKDRRDYGDYVECFKALCSSLKLKEFDGFYLDKYIQAIGSPTGSQSRLLLKK